MAEKSRFGTPDPEFDVGAALVAGLLADQHPDLAHLPLQFIGSGYDNVVYRLGDDFMVRLPRRAAALPYLQNERIWLPRIAPNLTLPVSVPVRTGGPGRGYPWPWTILPRFQGKTAEEDQPDRSQARLFGRFLRSLHVPAPEEAPTCSRRGVPLVSLTEKMTLFSDYLAEKSDHFTPEVWRVWEEGLRAPIDLASTWLHGDLHAWNVLVNNGEITGVIDWSVMTSGDPATDLSSIWMLFNDPEARADVIEAYGGLSEASVQRAKGWAIYFAAAMMCSGVVDNPAFVVIAERTLQRVVGDRFVG